MRLSRTCCESPAVNRITSLALIEPLVVMAIIAILAGLLLSAPGAAKKQAVRMVDVNNLKQVTLGLWLYSDDNRDNPRVVKVYGLLSADMAAGTLRRLIGR